MPCAEVRELRRRGIPEVAFSICWTLLCFAEGSFAVLERVLVGSSEGADPVGYHLAGFHCNAPTLRSCVIDDIVGLLLSTGEIVLKGVVQLLDASTVIV